MPAQDWGPIVEFPEFPTDLCYPCEAEWDLMGNIWTAQMNSNKMARINPETLEITEIPLPNKTAAPGPMERGPDGNIWFGEVKGNALAKIDPVTLEITTYELPWGTLYDAGADGRGLHTFGIAQIMDLTFGKDGHLWFHMAGENAIGRLTMDDYTFTKWDLETPRSGLFCLQPGPGNTIAFSAWNTNEIGLIDVFAEEISGSGRFPRRTPSSVDSSVRPTESICGSVKGSARRSGRLRPETDEIEEYELNGGPDLDPGAMRFGSDGKILVTGMYRNNNKLG